MFHQIWNLRYSTYIRIISCIGIEPFLLTTNLDIVSFSNVFSNSIYVFRCKGIVTPQPLAEAGEVTSHESKTS